MNMPKSRDMQVKIHEKSPKAIFDGFCLVTVRVLNSYVTFSLNLPVIDISSLLRQEYSYLQALQHDHSFQQKELFV